MNQKKDLSNLVPQLAAKLKAEIEEINTQEEALKAKQDLLQTERTKIHHAEEELKAQQTKLRTKRSELTQRLQEIRNEV